MVIFSVFLAENLSKHYSIQDLEKIFCDHKYSVQKFKLLFSNMTESQNVKTIMICLQLALSS